MIRLSLAFVLASLMAAFAAAAPAEDQHSAAYDSLVAIADELYEAEEYARSVDAYVEAFATSAAPDPVDLYNAACSASLSGQVERAYGFLHQAVDGGWRTFVNAGIDPDLKLVRAQTEPFAEVRGRVYRLIAEEAGEGFDAELAAELTDLYIRDQGIRHELREMEASHPEGVPDSVNSAFRQRWQEVDAANQERVIGIIEEGGWPGRSQVGSTGAVAVFLVVQHAPLETQEKYLPLLERAVEENEARPADLALLTDRVRMRRGEPQLYGSQMVRGEDGAWVFHPIEDPKNVNERRAAVGLASIEEYAARMGVDYP